MPSNGRDKVRLEDADGHVRVHWLDFPIAPTRWERWDSRWINLPAALLILLVVMAVVLPEPSVPMPAVSLSAPEFLGGDDDEPEDTTSIAWSDTPVAATPSAVAAAPSLGPADAAATPAPALADLASLVQNPPNELGGVPVIMYHAFVFEEANTNEWTLTFDQFREQLDWFREHDYVMVGVQSLIDGRFDVPAGKKPVILTFDDSNSGQFGLQKADDGGWEVKPDTAVGVLEAYRQDYPEFSGPAFFAILTWNCFESDDDPSTCGERLNWLVDNGYEIGNHTMDHVELTDVSADFFVQSIAEMIQWLNDLVPADKPGNLSRVVVMPFGEFPDEDLHGDQLSWLSEGFWYLGEPVNLDVVFGVNGGPAISPYSIHSFAAETYRIASDPGILGYWQEAMESGEAPVFISDGNPEVVTVPESQADAVDETWLADRGLELRTYDAGGDSGA